MIPMLGCTGVFDIRTLHASAGHLLHVELLAATTGTCCTEGQSPVKADSLRWAHTTLKPVSTSCSLTNMLMLVFPQKAKALPEADMAVVLAED